MSFTHCFARRAVIRVGYHLTEAYFFFVVVVVILVFVSWSLCPSTVLWRRRRLVFNSRRISMRWFFIFYLILSPNLREESEAGLLKQAFLLAELSVNFITWWRNLNFHLPLFLFFVEKCVLSRRSVSFSLPSTSRIAHKGDNIASAFSTNARANAVDDDDDVDDDDRQKK